MSGPSTSTTREIRLWIAAVADFAVIVAFVAIGRRTHGEDAGVVGFFRVLWPFAVGLAVAWLASGLARAPLAWRHAVAAWLLTVALGVGLRIVAQGHEFKFAFAVVALLFLGAGLLGWRAAVRVLRASARGSPGSDRQR